MQCEVSLPINSETSLQYLKGVGPKLGHILKSKGFATIADLIQNYPRLYEDRRAAKNIRSLVPGETVCLRAQVYKTSSYFMGKSRRKIYDITIKDESGAIHCKFFRVPYKGFFENFQPGDAVKVIAKVLSFRNQIEFHHPDISKVNDQEILDDAIVPIYVETDGISSTKMGKLIGVAISTLKKEQKFLVNDPMPEWIKEKCELSNLDEAIEKLHNPPLDLGDQLVQQRSKFHRRIIFDEFFSLELMLAFRRRGLQKEKAEPILGKGGLELKLLSALPFELTGAQKRTLAEIKKDLAKSQPMHRLVQGDVGSGKTMVAFLSALAAIEARFQSALMVPTEILAQQHFENAQKWLVPLGIKVAFLTGSTKPSEKADIGKKLISGEINLVIGTHALIQDTVEFKNLGLVIIDEQHRFGVEQRKNLKQKGKSPHFLVMTATPIPRSLAMTIYGDLDVSIIDELPKGRQPIITRVTYQSKRPEVLKFVADHIHRGRQAYIVFPLVDESEKIDLKSATQEFERLKTELPQFKLGLLHGKMKSDEKDDIMLQFRNKKIDILVSTTVIEVGVDVPNANIMWIEHSERFGLSQLHQLRGRVGRGDQKSFCILMLGHAVSQESRERVSIMESTSDGFKIAEADLEIRGPGEFLGSRQSGLPGFRMANLVRDLDILKQAREVAFEVFERDPHLSRPEHKLIKEKISDFATSVVG